jgi:hypothetical protein
VHQKEHVDFDSVEGTRQFVGALEHDSIVLQQNDPSLPVLFERFVKIARFNHIQGDLVNARRASDVFDLAIQRGYALAYGVSIGILRYFRATFEVNLSESSREGTQAQVAPEALLPTRSSEGIILRKECPAGLTLKEGL